MTRTHGRCPKGKRLHGKAPYGHWKTMTFVAGLRCDGAIAPVLLDCPMNSTIFTAYARQALARELRPGDLVRRENDSPDRFLVRLTMDNLSSHKGQQARKAIEACGAQILFLPPCSPEEKDKLSSILKS